LLDPKHTSAYIGRGSIYQSQKQYQKAIDDYTAAYKIDPTQAYGYYYDLANVAFAQNQLDQALSGYTKCIELDAKLPDAYLGRAAVYAVQGNNDKALADHASAIAAAPDDAEGYLERGMFYDQQGDFDKALADFNHVLASDPQNPDALDGRD